MSSKFTIVRCIILSLLRVLVRSKQVSAVEPYQLSPEEVNALSSSMKQQSTQSGSSPIHGYEDEKHERLTDTYMGCTMHSDEDPVTHWIWKYSFAKARCVPEADGGDRQRYDVTCHTRYTRPEDRSVEKTGLDVEFTYGCEDGYVCQDWDYQTVDFVDREDIKCVPEWEVITQVLHITAATAGQSATSEEYCREQYVPSRSDYGGQVRSLELEVTEKVMWPNGSIYKAPTLSIRDKTTRIYGFDRALKHHAGVASASMILRATGLGRLQQKKLDFCVELLHGKREYWLVLVYSWWKLSGRRGSIPAELYHEMSGMSVESM